MIVCLRDEAVNGGFEIGEGAEDAALEALGGELGEEAFDGVEPGCRGGREVEGPAGMLRQPLPHLGMLEATDWVIEILEGERRRRRS